MEKKIIYNSRLVLSLLKDIEEFNQLVSKIDSFIFESTKIEPFEKNISLLFIDDQVYVARAITGFPSNLNAQIKALDISEQESISFEYDFRESDFDGVLEQVNQIMTKNEFKTMLLKFDALSLYKCNLIGLNENTLKWL